MEKIIYIILIFLAPSVLRAQDSLDYLRIACQVNDVNDSLYGQVLVFEQNLIDGSISGSEFMAQRGQFAPEYKINMSVTSYFSVLDESDLSQQLDRLEALQPAELQRLEGIAQISAQRLIFLSIGEINVRMDMALDLPSRSTLSVNSQAITNTLDCMRPFVTDLEG